MALKGRIVWDGDHALVEGRLPTAAIFGGVAWSAFWFVGTLVALTATDRSMFQVGLFATGLVTGPLLFKVNLAIARWQFERIVDEIERFCAPPAKDHPATLASLEPEVPGAQRSE